jgi:magnesium-transporting ATPase (P-type)
MEAALDAFVQRAGVDVAADVQAAPERAGFPFDGRRRRMAVVAGDRLLVKGAPDAILSRCRPQPAGATEALQQRPGRACASSRLRRAWLPAICLRRPTMRNGT